LLDIRNHTNGVWIFLVRRQNLLQGTHSQVTMPYFATARSTVRSNLTCRTSREIILQDKFVVSMYECAVDHLLIVFGPEGHRCQRLSLATCEYRRAVCSRQIVHLVPDRAHCTYIATIQTNSFVQ